MKCLLIIIFCSIISQYAFGMIRRDAIIYNASGEQVEVFHLNGEHNKSIMTGKFMQIVYPSIPSCLPVSFSGKKYRFPCKSPPLSYLKPGLFMSTFKVVIRNDRRFYLIPCDTPDSEAFITAETHSQPEGWPIEGIPEIDEPNEPTGQP